MEEALEITASVTGRPSEEVALLEIRCGLKELLKRHRQKNCLSQQELAERMGTDQARICRIEKAHPSVSTDQLLRALIVVGATREEIAGVIARA